MVPAPPWITIAYTAIRGIGYFSTNEIRYFVTETTGLMFRNKLTDPDLLLIAANLFPVYGVWFLGWNATEAFIVYAMETMIAGIMTALKLGVATLARGKDDWYNAGSSTKVSGLFFIVFFMLHFGLFAAVQTSIFSETAHINPPGAGMFHFFFKWYTYINTETGYMLLAFIIGYLARSFIPFLLNGDYKTQPMAIIMFQPYGRIFIQQFTVILGSLFLGLNLGKGFILVFALAKIGFEMLINFDSILKKAMEDMKKGSREE